MSVCPQMSMCVASQVHMYQQNDDSDGWGIDESLIAVIMKDVCRALDGLHKKGLIHRDVKAANILVSNEGRAYLTDFGISKRK